jgi:hypothetical protein
MKRPAASLARKLRGALFGSGVTARSGSAEVIAYQDREVSDAGATL